MNQHRNRTSDTGSNSDASLRDESGEQPGTATKSSSKTDNENQQLTETAKDDFRSNNISANDKADPVYDDK